MAVRNVLDWIMAKILEALQRFFKQNPEQDYATRLYSTAVVQARNPLFFKECGVPDTLDGRFEMIAMHVFALIERARKRGKAKLAQGLFDAMFRDMEMNLREMGVGDLGIPKRMKRMMIAFNGRCHAYASALAVQNDDILIESVRRNVYGTAKKIDLDAISAISAYFRALLQAPEFSFPDPAALIKCPPHETRTTAA